jgi:LPS O-antigen subunit length determinant protein (WzzB/FepE family)
MLKLNASYSKKVPADTEYSSQSYHASVEVELPDGLTPEQLNARIHETFALVRDSVESELHGESVNAGQMNDVQQLPIQPAQQSNKSAYSKKPATDSPASPKQIKFLLDLARQSGYTIEQLKARFNVSALEDLSRTQCSRAIDLLNGKAA